MDLKHLKESRHRKFFTELIVLYSNTSRQKCDPFSIILPVQRD